MTLIGVWESSEAESIGDDKGIDLICLLFIGVGPFEIPDQLWVELIDGGLEGSQRLTGGQKVNQVEIEEGGCFGGYFELREVVLFQNPQEPAFQGLSTGEGIGEGLRSDLLSLRIHEADGIEFGTDITTNE